MTKLHIEFENKFFIVVDKPCGYLSVPARMGPLEKRPILKKLLEDQLDRKIWAVHRLDFEVSGLILFALDENSHRNANGWFEKHQILKTYIAGTTGNSADAEQFPNDSEWSSFLVRGKKRTFEAPYGQKSLTRASYLGTFEGRHSEFFGRKKEFEKNLLWSLTPVTGRSHQLRYELGKRNFPILGDALYGSTVQLKPLSIALRAMKIDFSQIPERNSFGLPDFVETESKKFI